MDLKVKVKINKTVELDLPIDDVVDEINDMPIQSRFNFIAKFINEIEFDDCKELSEEQIEIITKWLKARLSNFSIIKKWSNKL